MNITIKIIPHAEQRYPTPGDWFYVGEDLEIRVSKMSDWRYEMLIAEHEFHEAVLCEHAGVTQQAVDDFDKAYEANRDRDDVTEPGDDRAAPYRLQHFHATNSERQFAAELGVDWEEYADEIEALP